MLGSSSFHMRGTSRTSTTRTRSTGCLLRSFRQLPEALKVRARLAQRRRLHDPAGEARGAVQVELEREVHARAVARLLQVEGRAREDRAALGRDHEPSRRIVLLDDEDRLVTKPAELPYLCYRLHVHRLERLLPLRRALQVTHEAVHDLARTVDFD